MSGIVSIIALGFILTVFLLIYAAVAVRIVRPYERGVIERFGKYHATLSSGINVILPVVDRPREIDWRERRETATGHVVLKRSVTRIDLRETVYDFPRQNVITKDNVVTEINALLYFQIVDPTKSVYEIANLPDAIEKLTQTTLRNVAGELDLDEVLSSRDTINSKLRAILDVASEKWGVKVNRVELQDINPPREIRDAMEKQMRAERDRRAAILEAEGMKQAAILEAEGFKASQINRAEGEKQAAILEAEGQAAARINVAQAEAQAVAVVTKAIATSGGDPVNYLVALKYLETLKEMTSGQDNKVVYIPWEATGALGALGGIREMLAGNHKA